MNAIKTWFTPARREAIYTAIATLAPILVTAGVILPGNVEPILAIVAAGLQGFAGILALTNLKATEAARWFTTVGRAVIYSGATVVAGAVVALGIVTQEWATTSLTYASFGLTALAAIIGVVTPKLVPVSLDQLPVVAEAAVVEGAIVTPVITEGTITANSYTEGTITANSYTEGTIPAPVELESPEDSKGLN